MNTRASTIVALTVFASVSACLFSCSSAPSPSNTVEARLRNDLPPTCTAAQQQACPAVNVTSCPNGEEPVLDYSKDCCVHFTCQPLCQSASQKTCPMSPAPACPVGTKLWIGTAVEDCCPAYRCEPDGTGTCDATSAACTLALPYCGPNIQPIVVGHTADCCPIYQCACQGATADPTTGKLCGCTFPNCKAGEAIVCAGTDSCMGPCSCQPAQGTCTADAECASDARCDLSNCRLAPTPVDATMVALCSDPSLCGAALGLPNTICPDGVNKAGPTGRCLQNADGSCGWEIAKCPSAPGACYGVCVPNVQTGCKADTDCPSGQACSIACGGWGCSPGGTTTTGGGTTGSGTSDGGTTTAGGGSSTGSTGAAADGGASASTVCACPASDPTCSCDANGVCSGKTCTGQCVPAPTKCDPSKPVACPAIGIACPNGGQPIQNGVDPVSCCPSYTCPACKPSTTAVCPKTAICACAKQTGTDPASCCPTYECGPVNADGSCG